MVLVAYCIDCVCELIRSGSLFWWCALIGSGMFFIQFLINMFSPADHDSFDVGDTTLDGSDSTDIRTFKWFSLQTITGFLMMFGWTAITCQNQFGFQDSTTIGVAIVVGVLTALLLRFILKCAQKLHSSGSVYIIDDAIGKEAYVYQAIPKGGIGKISISLDNLTHEIDAVTCDGEELSSFTRVKIIKKRDENTLVVESL